MSTLRTTARRLAYLARLPAMRAAARGRPLPDFLIIGAQRSGTSSLYQALVTHPRIRAARVKEVHFFDVNFEKGVDWYRTHFPRLDADRGGSGRPITGEASPYYLPHVHAPKRVAAILGDVKLIVLLRDPVERAYSHYHSVRARCQEPLAFEEAIAAEDERTGRELERMDRDEGHRSIEYRRYSYLGRGHYAEQLERWFVHHPRERLVILASEDYYGHPPRPTRVSSKPSSSPLTTSAPIRGSIAAPTRR